MGPFHTPQRRNSGYSLMEVLVVLAIVGILSVAGASMIGNRGGNSVRIVMAELEGAIMDAHKYAVSTGRDVAIVTWGAWDVTGGAPTLYMVRGFTSIATTTTLTTSSMAIQDVVIHPPSTPTDAQKSVAVVFAPSRSREYMNAGVVIGDSAWWTNAMQANGSGKQNEDITTVDPFLSDASFQATNVSSNNLFKSDLHQISISGSNKRFNQSFIIQVVSTSGGSALPGGAMGLIVVQNNGATVYKFYNSGVSNGDGKWRRI